MDCSKTGGTESTEVLHGEIINHKSRMWMGWWCQLKPVVEFISLQRACLWLLLLLLLMFPEVGGPIVGECSSIKVGNAAVFQF